MVLSVPLFERNLAFCLLNLLNDQFHMLSFFRNGGSLYHLRILWMWLGELKRCIATHVLILLRYYIYIWSSHDSIMLNSCIACFTNKWLK